MATRIRGDSIEETLEMYLKKSSHVLPLPAEVIHFLSAEMISSQSRGLSNDKPI